MISKGEGREHGEDNELGIMDHGYIEYYDEKWKERDWV